MINELSFKPLAITALAVFSLNVATAYAAAPTGIQDAIPVAKALSGNKKDDGWYNLSSSSKTKIVDGTSRTIAGNTGYPSFSNSTAAWPQAIASQVNSYSTTSTAGFNKFGNGGGFGPYPATDGLYAISFADNFNAKGGTLGVSESAPIVGLANIVFQVELGSAHGYDFYQPTKPTGGDIDGGASNLQVGALTNIDYSPKLNLTFAGGATTSLTAGWAELSAKGENGTTTAGGTEEPIFVNLYAFQWDLTGYSNISSFSITFDVVQHSQTYAARLTQSDVFNQVVAVPEPESYAMFLAGLGLLGFAARRRQA